MSAAPYLVQAHRPGQFTSWVTDTREDTLEEARSAAAALHRTWGRSVRVIDQDEHVHLRLGSTKDIKSKRVTRAEIERWLTTLRRTPAGTGKNGKAVVTIPAYDYRRLLDHALALTPAKRTRR